MPFSFCTYFFGERDPRVPGEKGRLIGIKPLRERMRIKESQFLKESPIGIRRFGSFLSDGNPITKMLKTFIQEKKFQQFDNWQLQSVTGPKTRSLHPVN